MSVAEGDGEGPLLEANVSFSGYTRLWWTGGLSYAHLTVILLQNRQTGCGKKGRLAFPASLGPSRATWSGLEPLVPVTWVRGVVSRVL